MVDKKEIDKKDLVYEILINLKSVQHNMKSKMHDHFKDMELTAPQGMLIFMVSKHGMLKISEISEKMGLSNSTVSGIIDRLETQGLVERQRSKTDRRVVNVVVTNQMKEKLKSHDTILESIMTEALSIASQEQIELVHAGITMLSQLLNETNKEKTDAKTN